MGVFHSCNYTYKNAKKGSYKAPIRAPIKAHKNVMITCLSDHTPDHMPPIDTQALCVAIFQSRRENLVVTWRIDRGNSTFQLRFA